jgi:hypothetical protein
VNFLPNSKTFFPISIDFLWIFAISRFSYHGDSWGARCESFQIFVIFSQFGVFLSFFLQQVPSKLIIFSQISWSCDQIYDFKLQKNWSHLN